MMIVFDYSDIRARMERREHKSPLAAGGCFTISAENARRLETRTYKTVEIYVQSSVSAESFIRSRSQIGRTKI